MDTESKFGQMAPDMMGCGQMDFVTDMAE